MVPKHPPSEEFYRLVEVAFSRAFHRLSDKKKDATTNAVLHELFNNGTEYGLPLKKDPRLSTLGDLESLKVKACHWINKLRSKPTDKPLPTTLDFVELAATKAFAIHGPRVPKALYSDPLELWKDLGCDSSDEYLMVPITDDHVTFVKGRLGRSPTNEEMAKLRETTIVVSPATLLNLHQWLVNTEVDERATSVDGIHGLSNDGYVLVVMGPCDVAWRKSQCKVTASIRPTILCRTCSEFQVMFLLCHQIL